MYCNVRISDRAGATNGASHVLFISSSPPTQTILYFIKPVDHPDTDFVTKTVNQMAKMSVKISRADILFATPTDAYILS